MCLNKVGSYNHASEVYVYSWFLTGAILLF
jgi:hypothetical protein